MGDVVKLDVYKIDGSKTGEQLVLPAKIFGVEPNDHVIWLAVTAEQANQRQGTASTKTRAYVRGGGKKPWPQKGRGTARAGSIRSPLWVGGGRVFGPHPRLYKKQLPKKVSRLARKSALSYKAKEEKIRLIEDFNFEVPKTKKFMEMLTKLTLDTTKTLLLTAESDRHVYLSGRNIPKVTVREVGSFSTLDILGAEVLLIQKSALKKLNEVLGK